ncbi:MULTISPECIES: DUF1868 domain-containing protein [Vibrio]|uniref:DUF1868 domain-containing protein n=1 Tax=Vibrio bivalvicida TaxID=1276888 RepID=A0A177XX47_9VIBR|nr:MULTISPECIES: DUF1868 domain-containing protein [Vibrio]KLN63904.1 hypothetical protein ZX61_17355 [Vibrio sp. VPAP30]OAJ93159.1 hypothetical protein APB76_14425 [Vibrio bivalvicida]
MNYAPAVGIKFNQDGTVRQFPGNTFICHVDQSSELIILLEWAQNELKQMQCGAKFSFLPISSMHMTVFEGICDQVRSPEKWTTKLPLDTPLAHATDLFATEVSQIGAHSGFEMEFDYVYNCPTGGTSIRLKPATESSRLALVNCRERLRTSTGINMPEFDSYHFHITLSYRILELDEGEKQELQQTSERIEERFKQAFGRLRHGAVEFCRFDNMFKFETLLILS